MKIFLLVLGLWSQTLAEPEPKAPAQAPAPQRAPCRVVPTREPARRRASRLPWAPSTGRVWRPGPHRSARSQQDRAKCGRPLPHVALRVPEGYESKQMPDFVTSWLCGFVVLLFCVFVVLCFFGFLVFLFFDFLVFWFFGFVVHVVFWFCGFMLCGFMI